MNRSILLIGLIAISSLRASALSFIPQGDTLSKGTFILHKFQQAIGRENYFLLKGNDSIKLYSDFTFTDRGQPVPLQTSLVVSQNGSPLAFKIKGSTSRSSVIDSEVKTISSTGVSDSASIRVNNDIRKVRIAKPYYTISGYAPVAVQAMLISYWKKNGMPPSIRILPAGELRITRDGSDTLMLNNREIILDRYVIRGLIWGGELLWTDRDGNLVTLFTNDAEGDKFEAIREGYVEALPFFIGKAAYYGLMGMKIGGVEAGNKILALKGGTIVDVVTGKTITPGVVLIKDGVILKVGPQGKVKIPSSAKVMDVTGKTLLPGLWDMHAHFQQVEWGPAYLAAGVTTVRDCGNEFDFINSVERTIRNNPGLGPRILKAGIVDGDGKFALGIVRVNTREDAVREVKRYKDNGYSQIKIYSSIKPEMIKVISEEAHRVGLTVTGHVPIGVTAPEAVLAGQDQINHITFIYQAMLNDPKQETLNLTDEKPQAVLRMLKEKNVVVDPTLGIYEWIFRPLDQPVDFFEPGVNAVPEDLKEVFRNTGMPPDKALKRKALLKSTKEIVLAMHKMGIPIVAGTDMMVPGYSLYREVELYHEAGLTPLESIQAATIVPARVMHLDQESGSIDVGKRADIIVVDGNPLESISKIRNVITVIKEGMVCDPKKLREVVDFKP